MKNILFITIAFILVLSLCGCGNRVAGSADSMTYNRYKELEQTDPQDL